MNYNSLVHIEMLGVCNEVLGEYLNNSEESKYKKPDFPGNTVECGSKVSLIEEASRAPINDEGV